MGKKQEKNRCLVCRPGKHIGYLKLATSMMPQNPTSQRNTRALFVILLLMSFARVRLKEAEPRLIL